MGIVLYASIYLSLSVPYQNVDTGRMRFLPFFSEDMPSVRKAMPIALFTYMTSPTQISSHPPHIPAVGLLASFSAYAKRICSIGSGNGTGHAYVSNEGFIYAVSKAFVAAWYL